MTVPNADNPADTCPRCSHDWNSHGAGCTVGWFQDGDACHCPNDSSGDNAQTCGRVGCAKTGVFVDQIGQFFCTEHREGVPIDEIKEWS